MSLSVCHSVSLIFGNGKIISSSISPMQRDLMKLAFFLASDDGVLLIGCAPFLRATSMRRTFEYSRSYGPTRTMHAHIPLIVEFAPGSRVEPSEQDTPRDA